MNSNELEKVNFKDFYSGLQRGTFIQDSSLHKYLNLPIKECGNGLEDVLKSELDSMSDFLKQFDFPHTKEGKISVKAKATHSTAVKKKQKEDYGNSLSENLKKIAGFLFLGEMELANIYSSHIYKDLLNKSPDVEKIHGIILLTEVYLRQGNNEEANIMMDKMRALLQSKKKMEGSLISYINSEILPKFLYLEALQHSYNGDLENALKLLEKAEKEGYFHLSYELDVELYTLRGSIESEMGNPWIALEDLQHALNIAEDFGISHPLVNILCLIGKIYNILGSPNKAIQYLLRCLQCAQNLHLDTMKLLIMIGNTYTRLGDYTRAQNYLNRAMHFLETCDEFSNPVITADIYFELVVSALSVEDFSSISKYLHNLEEIDRNHPNFKISQLKRTVKAITVYHQGRFTDLAMAIDLFRQIADESVRNYEVTLFAQMWLCTLLLMELKVSKQPSVVNEINSVINKLLEIVRAQNNPYLEAQVLLLQAKLSLIHLELDEARMKLISAQSLAEKHQLKDLARYISAEHDKMLEHHDIWIKFQADNRNWWDSVDLSNVETHLQTMLQNKAILSDEENNEIPVGIFILNETGPVIFSHIFEENEFLMEKEQLFSGLIAAFKSVSGEIFASSFDRARFGDYSVMVLQKGELIYAYIYRGRSFRARARLRRFLDFVHANPVIYGFFITALREYRIINLKDCIGLDMLLEQVFFIDEKEDE